MKDSFPTPDSCNLKTDDVICAIINTDELHSSYFDTAGRFPQRSSRGTQYVMVGYHYDANTIWGVPMKDRTASSMVEAWETLHELYAKAAVVPHLYILDNETSKDLLEAFNTKQVDYQLVPPNHHRNNLAERAIQTWKHHFKAGLATVDPAYPLSEWDRLIEQANITLNLLRSSRANPNLSAYAYLFGQFNFQVTPLAPPGTKVVAHNNPTVRDSWELNGEIGWYVGPAMHHYRCITCYFPKSRSTRTCDIVKIFPTVVPFPSVTITDHLKQAATDIVTILLAPPSTTVPSLAAGDQTRNAILDLATQLQRIEPIPTPVALPPQSLSSFQSENSSPTSSNAALPRVKDSTEHLSPAASSPRVTTPSTFSLPTSTLLQKSNLPKNCRFNNTNQHRYPLRSRSRNQGTNFRSLTADTSLAQHIFHQQQPYPVLNHISKKDGTRELLESLLMDLIKRFG